MKKRILALLILSAMLLAMRPAGVLAAMGQTENKVSTSRAISVVFDNSGSMYMPEYDAKAWCRATYAMEVFASMMNEGDVMQVHPMNKTYLGKDTSGTAYEYGVNPLVINGPGDALKLRSLYLDMDKNEACTPIESIPAAYESLLKMSGDEKYLIVLTDGKKFEEGGKSMSEDATRARLKEEMERCAGVNVMFLGIGNMKAPDGNNNKDRYYRVATESASVLSNLTEMCNVIFGRDELKNVGSSVALDISLKKMIVFAQGDGAGGVSVAGQTPSSSVETRYSEEGINPEKHQGAVPDTTLQGVIITYGAIPAGSYKVEKSGDPDVSIYYEPDVDLVVRLLDPNGNELDPEAEAYPGEYTIEYYLIDKQTGKKVDSKSPLLGSVKYQITYYLNDEKKELNVTEPGSVSHELAAGDTIKDGSFHVEYLSGYTIEKDGASDFGWPELGFNIDPRPAGFVELVVTGGQSEYPLAQLEGLAVYDVKLLLEGSQMTAEQLARVTGPELKLEGGNAQVTSQPTETGFTVYIKYNDTMDQTDPGDYTLAIGATYTNEDGQVATPASVVRNFSVIRRAVEGLSLQLTGGQSDYPLTQLEELAVYEAQLFLNDQPITGEAFARISNVTAALAGGNALAEVETAQDRFLVRIRYNGTAADTAVGEYTLTLSASYANEDGQTAQAQSEPVVFTITDDTSDLGVSVQLEQDYYAQTEMDKAKPIYVVLTYAGEPLTAEQFTATKLTVNIDKLATEAYRVEADAANSRYIVTLIKNEALKNGNHTLQATADSVDEVGRAISAKGSGKFTVSPCPAWMIVLFWVLLVLLILGLIWAYMNMKILPKQIGAGKGSFTVEGELITGNVRCGFSGKNKKKGFVEVTSPQCMTNPMAKCGFKLELEAISPRRTKSASRRARVVGITPLNPATTTSLVIGSWRMAKDPVSGKLVKVGGKPNAPVDFNIGNNCATTIVAEIMDLTDGGEIACSLSVPLKFY